MYFDALETLLTGRPLSDILRFAAAKACLQPLEEEGGRESQRITVRAPDSEDAITSRPAR